MRKFTKLTCIVLVLVSLLSICSGCMVSDKTKILYFGVPFAEGSEQYKQLNIALKEANMFTKEYFVEIALKSYTPDKAGKEKLLKEVKSDDIAFFYYERDDLINPLLEGGEIASYANLKENTKIRDEFPFLYEAKPQYMLDTATDDDGVNYMYPTKASYQGIFFNEDIFVANNLKIPNTWEQFTAAINTLKAAGVTPIAGGFADQGLNYIMDELILMEGGVAGHLYVPKYGVVNSWERAINDFKALKEMGAFNADCMTKSFADAKAMFDNGSAAMIIAPSKQIATDEQRVEEIGVFPTPVSSTGAKKIGDIICDYEGGIYINAQYLKKQGDIVYALATFIMDYVDASAEDNYDGTYTEPEYGYKAYKSLWSMPSNPYAIGIEEILYDEEGNLIEIADNPEIMREVKDEDVLQDRVLDMMEGVTSATRSLSTEFKTFDYFIGKVREYVEKGGDLEAMIVEVTEKEKQAQAKG